MYCYELICVQVTLLESEHQLLRHKVGSHGMQWFMCLLLCSADTSRDDMLTQGYLGQNPNIHNYIHACNQHSTDLGVGYGCDHMHTRPRCS